MLLDHTGARQGQTALPRGLKKSTIAGAKRSRDRRVRGTRSRGPCLALYPNGKVKLSRGVAVTVLCDWECEWGGGWRGRRMIRFK